MTVKQTHSITNWLKQYWFIFGALLTVGITWGQTTSKINTLEEKINNNVAQQTKIEKMATSQSRLDERTLIMQQEQRDQKELLMKILEGQQKIIQTSDKAINRKKQIVTDKDTK